MSNRRREDLADCFRRGPALFDGAMGTQLYDRAGIDLDRCPEELSLSDPELVKAIHLD